MTCPSIDLAASSEDMWRREQQAPVAARAAENDIEVTFIVGLDAQTDSITRMEHAVRIDFHARTVLHPFQDPVTETQRDSRPVGFDTSRGWREGVALPSQWLTRTGRAPGGYPPIKRNLAQKG